MTDTDILFIWLFVALAFGGFASIVQAYCTPEAREARARNRAVQLANEQPMRRRRRRMQRATN